MEPAHLGGVGVADAALQQGGADAGAADQGGGDHAARAGLRQGDGLFLIQQERDDAAREGRERIHANLTPFP